jgi:hypothetical protein
MLYRIIHRQICANPQTSSLLEHVRFEYLSRRSLESFISLISESFDFLTFAVWRSLCPLLSRSESGGRIFEIFNPIERRYSSAARLAGIISHLTAKSAAFDITASSSPDSRYSLRSVTDFSTPKCFYMNNERGSWIRYDFRGTRVCLTHYSTRRDADDYHLRYWHLDGSLDGREWVELDRRENDTSLRAKGAVAALAVSDRNHPPFRMIRLQQHGPNSNPDDHLALNAIEFFGVLTEPHKYTIS